MLKNFFTIIFSPFSFGYTRSNIISCQEKIDEALFANPIIGAGEWECSISPSKISCSVKCEGGKNPKVFVNKKLQNFTKNL